MGIREMHEILDGLAQIPFEPGDTEIDMPPEEEAAFVEAILSDDYPRAKEIAARWYDLMTPKPGQN